MRKIVNTDSSNKTTTQLTIAINQLIDEKLSVNLIQAQVSNGTTTLINSSLTSIKGYILVSSDAEVTIWKTAVQPSELNKINITANNTANITLLVF